MLALILGALYPLAFAPLAVFPLALLIPAYLFWCWSKLTARQAAWHAYLFGLGMFAVGASWVYIAIHDFGFTAAPIAFVLTALFVAFLALFLCLQAYLSNRVLRRFSASKYSDVIRFVWIYPLFWLLFEWIRGLFLTGFPWLNLGYSQIDTPLAGYAPLLGVYGVSWLGISSAGLLLLLKQRMLPALLLLAGIWLGGYLLAMVSWSQPLGQPLKVALVQGNLPQITKWDKDKIKHRQQFYAELSEPYWGKTDIIVWPENSMNVFFQDLPAEYIESLQQKARQHNTDLIMGVPYLDIKTDKYYSSMYVIGQREAVFHKRHLVPFGEYVPLADLLRGLIGFFDLPMSGFSAGAKQQAHLRTHGQPLATTICYEDAFGEELIRYLPEATLLLNGSNNAWYGKSWAPHQHLQISRMRALETSRDLMRATTNGISAFVDYKGKFIKTSEQFKSTVITAQVQPRSGATPYVRFGNWPVIVYIILSLMLITGYRFFTK